MKAVHRRAAACIACFGVWVGTSGPIRDVQGEDLTLATATRPAPNAVDEPRADRFSLDKAVAFLDQASLEWTASRKCFTCHTNYAYLMARPAVSAENTAHREVRAELEKLVTGRWAESGPRWDAEVVMTAAALAINDRATTGKLHAITRQALDRMWTVQRGDGGFNWLKCKWPPMESDDHFGATMAAIAVGAAPEDYSKTESARAGLARIKAYFVSEPAATVHHRAMLAASGPVRICRNSSTARPVMRRSTKYARSRKRTEDGRSRRSARGNGPTARRRTSRRATGTPRGSPSMSCAKPVFRPTRPKSNEASHGSRRTSARAAGGLRDPCSRTATISFPTPDRRSPSWRSPRAM